MHLSARCFVLMAILALTALPASADELISVKAGYQVLSPQGDFAVSGNSLAGTPIDLEHDLNYDDSQNLTAEAALQLGDFRLAAGYLPIEFSGSGSLGRDVVFNGQTFSGQAQAASDVDINLYDVGLTYQLFNFDDLPTRFQFGPEIAVKVVDADLSLDGQEVTSGLTTHQTESVTVPIPTVGARLRVGLADFVALVGRIGYMEVNDNSFLDADAQIEFSPLPLAGIYGGYRYFDVQVDESDIYIDAQLSGPYIGAFVRF